MKHILLAGLILFAVINCEAILQLGMGVDALGRHKLSYTDSGITASNTYNVNMGLSPYAEILSKSGTSLLGFGIEFQFPRGVSIEDHRPGFGFMPFYGVGHLSLSQKNKVYPEVIGQLGFNAFFGDDEYKGESNLAGGPFYGLGFGIGDQKVRMQIMYKSNFGSITESGYKFDISNSQINLSFGLRSLK